MVDLYPGAVEDLLVPELERISGMTCAYSDYCLGEKHFYVGYSPERVNPGDQGHRIENITKVTSGSTPQAARAIDALYNEIVTAGTHLASSIKVAEAAKVIENTQRDINIAFMNELSKLFSLLDVDTSEVIAAAATKWNFLPFRPGLLVGTALG